MVALVAVETVLLVLLVALVAGLLRSHAEILRRLGPAGGEPVVPPPASVPARVRGVAAPAVAGTTPTGDVVKLAFDGTAAAPTLLAFLSTGCDTCAGFWDSLGDGRLPAGTQTVIVTRGAERESPSRLRSLAPEDVPVVMSSRAWEDYQPPGAPYFVLVDGHVRGEGAATTWAALSSLVSDAIEDERSPAGGTERARRVDATLASAGITAGHPSLYPAGPDEKRP
jgi:hypothetical protein